ncbi:MAG: AraC family transcriptional regulator [uncultured Sulfurovum sp.]|uniref:AraC family transcriptional regulator n=1 Tax=uncultured Sulfurovum sp. TaxID=269237 RepID=A0A6S6SL43_9BACT|nr:MAG: AraC family transcriptional regulator [uncultured Sulfurovum sp.]
MTYLVPNYFLENEPNTVISSDTLFTLSYSTKRSQDRIYIRNTTHVMILLKKGEKKLTTDKEDLLLHRGDILLLTQGNYFMSEVLSEDGIYQALLVYFNDEFVMNFIKKYDIKLSNNESQNIISFSSNTLLKSLIDSFELYLDKKLERHNEIVKLKTEEIFLHLLNENEHSFYSFLKAIRFSSKDRIKYILEANIDLIDTVEDMCKIARVSKNELRLAFKNSVGMQPKVWLDSKRLEQASLMLTNSNETISSIATTCGYNTVSWFGVQFKKAYGVTPKVYREQNS